MISTLAGIVCYRGKICAEQGFLWLDLGAAAENYKNEFDVSGFQTTDVCAQDLMRNNLIQSAIQSKAQWLIMLEADYFMFPTKMSQPGSDIFGMIRLGEERQAALVAANVSPGRVIAEQLRDLDPLELKGGVHEVDKVAVDIAAINIQWLLNEWSELPWFKTRITVDQNHPEGFHYEPSEFHFCSEIRKRNGLILCDGRVGFGRKVQV